GLIFVAGGATPRSDAGTAQSPRGAAYLKTCRSYGAWDMRISGFYKHDAPPELEIEGGSGHYTPPTPAPEAPDIRSRGCNPRIKSRHKKKPRRGDMFVDGGMSVNGGIFIQMYNLNSRSAP